MSGLDMYASCGDAELMSKATESKEFTMCADHNNPKELFHFETRMILCSQCLVDKRMDRDLCVEARKFCQALMQRYVTLLDNATYMPIEHVQKEKEYGIPWRSAFKAELEAFTETAKKRLLGEVMKVELADEPFVFFHKIVKKDALDAATFDAMSQADFMCMMLDNLEICEQWLYQIKALLKEPDFHIFEDLKTQTLEQVLAEQLKMNPKCTI